MYVLLFSENCDPPMAQFCTCHNSLAIVSCAKMWSHWIKRIKITEKRFFTTFQLGAHKLFVQWVSADMIRLLVFSASVILNVLYTFHRVTQTIPATLKVTTSYFIIVIIIVINISCADDVSFSTVKLLTHTVMVVDISTSMRGAQLSISYLIKSAQPVLLAIWHEYPSGAFTRSLVGWLECASAWRGHWCRAQLRKLVGVRYSVSVIN